MISAQAWKQEVLYLDHVMAVIDAEYRLISIQFQNRTAQLHDYRRQLWENRRDFNNLYEMAEYEDRLREDLRGFESIEQRKLLLEKAARMPYFGRVDFQALGEDLVDQLYVGLTSVIEREQFDILVTDWRAPAAGMYYEYEVGPARYEAPDGEISGVIILKRQYKIKNRQLVLAVDTGMKIDDDILLETLSSTRSPKMHQIVLSIQREQNKVIRDRKSRYLWIQGVAGSGKTSIALHRIAYLLYHRRSHLSASSFVIFSPNQIFIDYISDVLPELGEENAQQLTFYDCAYQTLGHFGLRIEDSSEQLEYLFTTDRQDPRHAIAHYKMSESFNQVLSQYVANLNKRQWQFKDVVFAKRMVYSAQEAEKLFNDEYAHVPLSDRLEQVVNRIIYLVGIQYRKVNEERLRQAIYEAAPHVNSLQLYYQLFTDLALWQQLTDVEIPQDLTQIAEFTVRSLDSGNLLFEDTIALLYLQSYIEGLNISGNVRHVVVDEVQDYTILQLEIMKKIFPDADFTLLGDINQAIHPYNQREATAATTVFGADCRQVILNKCYRSTKAIAKLANHILPQPSLEIIEREGVMPVLHRSKEPSRAIQKIIASLSTKNYESVAIIAKTLKHCKQLHAQLAELGIEVKLLTGASRHFATGITVLPSYISKGLEFDAVIIADADCAVYNAEEDHKLFYTLATRPLHELHFVAHNPLTTLLEAATAGLLTIEEA